MIDLEKDNGVWTVRINRPDKANSLTPEMLAELVEVANAAQDARALILTGAGKVFSAGADLEAARAGLAISPVWEELSGALAALPCLTVAALNGTLAGGANGMALACDLRICTPHAKFFYPVMSLGYLPQPSDPVRMAALIGPARTKLIFAAGQKIDAKTAFAYGLVDEIIEDGDVLGRAKELVEASSTAEPDLAAAIIGMCE